MVLLVFLVDTSASMNQKTCLGTTYLDIAKGAVESFLKIRARDTNASRGDRYMLVTFGEPNKSVKAGWRENLAHFSKELKNLQAFGLTDLGHALKETFDLLNMPRLQSGIDNYGMGRNPYYLEPALVMLFSDGCSLVNANGVAEKVSLSSDNPLPGAELTTELFRWDQRLFALALKIPGFALSVTEKLSMIQTEDLALSNLCEETGGKLYSIGSHKMLMQSLESIAQKIAVPGVIINFEKVGPDPEPVVKEGSKTPKREEETSSPVPTENNSPSSTTTKAMSSTNTLPLLNGFVPPQLINEKLMNGNMTNGFLPTDANGNLALGGLLMPPPLLPPGLMPPPIPVGMLPRGMKGLLPPPIPGMLHPIPFPPPPIMPMKVAQRAMNGQVEEESMQKTFPQKSEGQTTSGPSIPDNPIRGDEQSMLDRSLTVISPTIQPAASTAWNKQRRMIYVRTNIKGSVGHWPIPEAFWPDSSMSKLPPRHSHPLIKFQCIGTEAMIIDNMPFDKYELEPSPLTQYILERKQPNVAWQVFVSGSACDSELGQPFGYIKASTNLQCVNLFILPYNYAVVMPLLDELFKVHKCKPTMKWQQSFEQYLRKMPGYYVPSLQNALRRMGAPTNLIPEHMDGSLSYSIISYLKKVKHQAKNEAERLINMHSHQNNIDIIQISLPCAPQLSDGKQNDYKQLLLRKDISRKRIDHKFSTVTSEVKDGFANRNLPSIAEKFQRRSYRNPFDIHRSDLIEHVTRMRRNFFHMTTAVNQQMQDEEAKHRVAISTMGNYKEPEMQHVKPLREVDPSQVRLHTFGNPFKLKQQDQHFVVDEADASENAFNQNSRKRANNEPIASKIKRKRSDSVPSRRPVGQPNTPPPKPLAIPKPEAKNIISQITEQTVKTEEVVVVKDDSPSKKEEKKQVDSSVNQQLRKLQKMHRIRKVNNTMSEAEEANDTFCFPSVNVVPILSSEIKKTDSPSDNRLLVDCFESLSLHTTRQAMFELQRRSVVKIRLALWAAIRERKAFSHINDLLDRLSVTSEAKFFFLRQFLCECERFNLTHLVSKLVVILSSLTKSPDS